MYPQAACSFMEMMIASIWNSAGGNKDHSQDIGYGTVALQSEMEIKRLFWILSSFI
jgi:hypothetical protein